MALVDPWAMWRTASKLSRVGGRKRRKRKGTSVSAGQFTVTKKPRRSKRSKSRSTSRKSKAAKLVKGSLAAKRFMANLRKMRK